MDIQLKKLIELSQQCGNIKNRDLLREVEDEFAKNYTLLNIEQMCKDLKRFVVYSSLPFTLKNDSGSIEDIWRPQTECVECNNTLVGMKALPTGNINAKYMVVGDAPGSGGDFEPFSRAWVYGPSSIILRLALAKNKMFIDTWFTNLLICALKNNRESEDSEIKNCFPFLKTQIKKINPDKIVLLGKHVQSKLEKIKHDTISVYHPAYFVRRGKGYKEYADHINSNIKGG